MCQNQKLTEKKLKQISKLLISLNKKLDEIGKPLNELNEDDLREYLSIFKEDLSIIEFDISEFMKEITKKIKMDKSISNSNNESKWKQFIKEYAKKVNYHSVENMLEKQTHYAN